MDLDSLRRHRPSSERGRLVPRRVYYIGPFMATIAVAASLVGFLLVDPSRSAPQLTLVALAAGLVVWNALELRRTRGRPAIRVRPGAVVRWAAAGAAFGLASWLFVWWQDPSAALLIWKGPAFVVVATAAAATHGWVREAGSERAPGPVETSGARAPQDAA